MAIPKGKTFFAEVTKGYIPKTMFDVLATNIDRITLRLMKKGIFIREFDTDDIRFSHILWDVSWPRERFAMYQCDKEYIVTLNANHLQRMLRSVRKKDSLLFFICEKDETQFGITIQPAGARLDGPAARSETVYLSTQHIKIKDAPMPVLPETYFDEEGNERQAYGFPMVIGATDFQKIKKMSGATKTLNVKIQKSNYISFFAGDVTVMSSNLEFGQMTNDPDQDDDINLIADKEESGINDSPGEEECENKDDSSDEESDEEEFPSLYEKSFAMSLFAPLVKLPGLTAQMEFYAPRLEQFPLKVIMHASSCLGDITVFIKDQKQIALDDQNKAQENTQVTTGKGKRAKK